jgi:RNA polymerase sigma factor (sigma-70 family)
MSGHPSIDDLALIARIGQQDQEALALLYDRYVQVLFAVAFKILGSTEEAEEVVLDVWRQVWRQAHGYSSQRGRVDTWLFMLLRSRALDRLRSLKRSERAIAAAQDLTISASQATLDPTETVLIAERCQQVQAALSQLPKEQRQVLELVYYRGLSHAEIAAQTGQPLGTIKTRIRLGLVKLRQTLIALQSSALS